MATNPTSTPAPVQAFGTPNYATVLPPKRKNRWLWWAGGVVVLLLVLAIVGKRMGWVGKEETIQVATEKPVKRDIIETVLANGKVQAEVEVKISSEVSGEIIELTVQPGDSVVKGQLLVKVNPDILQSALDQNAAGLNNAIAGLGQARARLSQQQASFTQIQASYTRSKKLFEQKVISQSEWETAEAQYNAAKEDIAAVTQSVNAARFSVESAKSAVNQTQRQLTRTTIYAPMSGIVTRVNSKRGETVVGTSQMAGTEIMTIANLSRMEVSVDVSENDIVRIQKGDTSMLEIDAFPKKKFMGRVREIANATALSATGAVSADQVTNYTVKISIDPASYAELRKTNPRPLLPGMSASVEIRTDRASQVLSVPIVSVTSRENNGEAGAGETDSDSKSDKTRAKAKSDSAPKPATSEADAETEGASEAVFVYSNGKVKLVPVKTGLQDDEFMTILSGLKGDEEVVIAPFSAISKTLKDGAAAQKVAKDKLFEDAKE